MKFRLRLIIAFTLLIAVTFGVGGTLLISTSFYSILNEEKEAVIREYETVQNNLNMLISFSDDGDYNNMHELLSQMETQNISHWQAISLTSKGTKIYESGNSKLLPENMELRKEQTYAYVQKMSEGNRQIQMYSELPVGNDTLYFKASYELSNAYSLRDNQHKLFFIIYVLVVIAGIGMASLISGVLTHRLQSLTNAVREIAEGNLSQRTGLKTGDEFEQLSKDIDKMTETLEENILKLEEDVERQEAFMGAVAHELKTPLTSIIGYADLLRQCGLDENEGILAANYIYEEGKRLENLSHKILDLLLLEKDTFFMKEIELDEFLNQVVTILKPMGEEKGVLLKVESEKRRISVEPDLAKSLIYNLVDNGIKATGKGGKVLVVGKAMENGCRISIADNGCGMKEKELTKITEAFYRVDKSRSRSQGGVGLGLTLCKNIVDLHHGNMWLQSTPGKGSCVTIELYDEEEKNEKKE